MKAYQKITLYGILFMAAIFAIAIAEQTFWRIALPAGMAFVGYIIYELDHAVQMPEGFEDQFEYVHVVSGNMECCITFRRYGIGFLRINN